MKEKQVKLILKEAENKNSKCYECIFYISGQCHEPYNIDCDTMGKDVNKTYYWDVDYEL